MKKNIKKEQNKKKLSKNWKLYASALGALVIGTGTGLGIYYGITNNSEVTKTDLSTLELETTILSKKNMTQEAAFNDFLNANKNITDLKTNLEIQENSFQKPTYATNGSLTINAKANSKYTGSVTVTITKLVQTNLNMLISNTIIQGREQITDKEAFNDFLNANKSWSNLNDFVEYSTFIAPTYTSNGSLTITAKANTAFTGSVQVTINAIGQTNLTNLNLNTSAITGTKDMTTDTAFNQFLNNNQSKNITDLKENVSLSFIAPDYDKSGLLTITAKANSKYIGTITITINRLIATDQDIVDAVTNSNIVFDADKTYSQSLENFIYEVIQGNNKNNTDNDPHWYLNGQIKKHINDIPILKYVDPNKFTFVHFEFEGHELTNEDLLKQGVGATVTIQVIFNYGSILNQSIDFNLHLIP